MMDTRETKNEPPGNHNKPAGYSNHEHKPYFLTHHPISTSGLTCIAFFPGFTFYRYRVICAKIPL